MIRKAQYWVPIAAIVVGIGIAFIGMAVFMALHGYTPYQ